MKEYLASLVSQAVSQMDGRNVAREYLQARILGSLQHSGAMIPLAFHGGTALRFLFSHGRYSEDLDFALENDRENFDFRSCLQAVRSDLMLEGYTIDVKVNDRKTVNSALIRFPGILYELDLSPQRNEVLMIKIEVDTCPPAGAGLATTVVHRYVMLQLHHHDKASLLSGKLHALLQRKYIKGRDIYDLLWYLSDPTWPLPNFTLLNNALAQTGWESESLTEDNWRKLIMQRLSGVNWNAVVNDVRPFVEPGFDLKLLSLSNFQNLLRK
jgi:predicted nucleotidyltransferase component of viral defense system